SVVSGTITDTQGPVQGALVQACLLNPPVQACPANNGACSLIATTDASGNYQITDVPVGMSFNLSVFPPSGSLDLPGQLLNLTVSSCGTPLAGQDVMLQLPPPPPPPGIGIEPHHNGAGGVPS